MAQTASNVHKNATQYRCLPQAPGLFDFEEGAQPAMECRGSTGN